MPVRDTYKEYNVVEIASLKWSISENDASWKNNPWNITTHEVRVAMDLRAESRCQMYTYQIETAIPEEM